MRTALRTAGIVLVAFVLLGSTAQAAVVSATLTDPQGDGSNVSDVHPWDLASFGIEYDDAGTLTVSFSLYDDERTGVWAGYAVEAQLGYWQAERGLCDANLPGAAFVRLLPNVDAPVPNSWVSYAVVGHREVELLETFPQKIPSGYVFTLTDPAAFADRGYDCVRNMELRGEGRGQDGISPVAACLGPSGTVPCPGPPQRVAVRWFSPRDGQTVSGFMHEGESDCLAVTSGPIVRTENWVDGAFHDAQSSPPWGCEIDTRQLVNGEHTLTVKAFAADGRMAEDTIRVHVSNPTASPPPATGGSGGGGTSNPSSDPAAPPTVPAASPAPTVTTLPPAGGAPPQTATDVDTTAARPLTAARAAAVSRRALTRRFGRAFAKRSKAGHRLTCRPRGAARATCRVAWRYRSWRYAGTVRVTRTRTRDAARVDVTRRRVKPVQPR